MSAPRKGPRLSIIPGRAADDLRLTLLDLRLLCVLGRHTDDEGWCYPNQARIAQQLDVARTSVSKAITRLVGAGYVETRPRTLPGKGKVGCFYRVILDPPFADTPKPVCLDEHTGKSEADGAHPVCSKENIGADVLKLEHTERPRDYLPTVDNLDSSPAPAAAKPDPVTLYERLVTQTPSKRRGRPKRPETPPPDGDQVPEAARLAAIKMGVLPLRVESMWAECLDWHSARGIERVDWVAVFRQWVRKRQKFDERDRDADAITRAALARTPRTGSRPADRGGVGTIIEIARRAREAERKLVDPAER